MATPTERPPHLRGEQLLWADGVAVSADVIKACAIQKFDQTSLAVKEQMVGVLKRLHISKIPVVDVAEVAGLEHMVSTRFEECVDLLKFCDWIVEMAQYVTMIDDVEQVRSNCRGRIERCNTWNSALTNEFRLTGIKLHTVDVKSGSLCPREERPVTGTDLEQRAQGDVTPETPNGITCRYSLGEGARGGQEQLRRHICLSADIQLRHLLRRGTRRDEDQATAGTLPTGKAIFTYDRLAVTNAAERAVDRFCHVLIISEQVLERWDSPPLFPYLDYLARLGLRPSRLAVLPA